MHVCKDATNDEMSLCVKQWVAIIDFTGLFSSYNINHDHHNQTAGVSGIID